ncbi:hypothetical protein [Natronococcus sp. A-GB7]|nr:hypothetical protein [Natronococcus sp. A-GB7]MDG5821954.1 hypothetical protein [Natronococcus sp. A-GB7]
MSSASAWKDKTKKEVQENIDQAVEDAINFDFASFDEVEEAFNK